MSVAFTHGRMCMSGWTQRMWVPRAHPELHTVSLTASWSSPFGYIPGNWNAPLKLNSQSPSQHCASFCILYLGPVPWLRLNSYRGCQCWRLLDWTSTRLLMAIPAFQFPHYCALDQTHTTWLLRYLSETFHSSSIPTDYLKLYCPETLVLSSCSLSLKSSFSFCYSHSFLWC